VADGGSRVRVRLAVLDMIGTTVQEGPEVVESFVGAFDRIGVVLSREAVDAVRGRSKREAIDALVAEHVQEGDARGRLAAETYAAFRATLGARYEEGARPVFGAREAVEALLAGGTRVALNTGLDRQIADRIIRGLRWEDLGLPVLTADDVARGRPAPDLVLAAMTEVGEADPATVLVAGDTVADLEAGHRAGAGRVIGVSSGAHSRQRLLAAGPTAVLDSVADIPGWLEREGRSVGAR
jgi:phosphonatase-like hydrolase